MPKFSKTSLKKLSTCDPKLIKIFTTVIENYDCIILVGHRGEKEQEEAYKTGKSKKRWGESKHNFLPSKAVDVSPYPIPKNWGVGNRDEYEKFRYFGFYVKGVADTIGIKIRWGGDWDNDKDVTDQNFNDLVHFELLDE